jgi:membrane-associated phospholipid phosphatase
MLYRILISASNAIFCKRTGGILAVLLLFTNIAYAGNRNDTVDRSFGKYLITNKVVRKGIAPVFFLASSALTWNGRVAVRDARNRYIPNFSNHIDDYMQYMPAAGVFALNLAGKKGLNHLSRAVINWGAGMLIMSAMVHSVKYASKVMRPDNTSANSFPSGHTATAFMNASFLNKEFGCRNAAYGIAGYAMGALTGIERSLNNRHWISDVLAGAGIGILSTEFAYMIVNRFYKNQGDYFPDCSTNTSYRTTENYSHVSAHVGYSFLFDKKGVYPLGTGIAVDGFYYFSKNWGIGSKVVFTHYPFKNESLGTDIFDFEDIQIKEPQMNIQSAGMFDFMAGIEYSRPLGSKFLLQARAMAGLAAGVKGEVSIDGTVSEKDVPVSLSLLEYRPLPAPVYGIGVAFTGMMASHVGLSLFIDGKHSSPVFEFQFSKQSAMQQQQRRTVRTPINSMTVGLRLTAFFD